MIESRRWQKAALALNLAGATLLFLSFQATSSNIRIVTSADGRTALCVEDRAMTMVDRSGRILLGGNASTCPEPENARPAAIVNVEYPFLVTLGFIMLLTGFVIQYYAVPDPATIQKLRDDLKEARRIASQRKRKEV